MQADFSALISRFPEKKVLVWGDFILDEYVYTSTARVSRESPVLVAEYERSEQRLGGAGNVVCNIHSLGAAAIPVGFIGQDRAGRTLKSLLRQVGLPTEYLLEVPGLCTTCKSRILAGAENTRKQQVLRIDAIERGSVPRRHGQRLLRLLQKLTKTVDAVIISDYQSQAVPAAHYLSLRARFPRQIFCLDSRQNLLDFPGITVATPNEPELRRLFPQSRFATEGDFLSAGAVLHRRLSARGIVLKRGQKGMIVFARGQKPHKLAIFGTDQIVDVTGAGDTVLAVVGLALAAGASFLDAARLANIAGGIVVMKEGAYPIAAAELRHAVG